MENQVDSAVTTEETTIETTTEVDEDITIAEGDEMDVVAEFTDTDSEEESEEEVAETKKEKEGKEKPKQSKEKNKEYAEKRRAEAAAKEETELTVLKEYVGKNPYTGDPIETIRDVKVYKTMKQIDKNGGDPIGDYHKYAGLEEQKALDDKKTRADNVKKEVEDFKSAFPEVNLKELSKDKDFVAFSNKLLGKIPLKDVYDAYNGVKNGIKSKAEETAKTEIARKIAKDKTSAGNIATSGDANAPKYTLEQIGKMSPSEINGDWANIEKSYNYWQKHKK